MLAANRNIISKTVQKCVYCGERDATTRDHVPPKCLFPKPRPSNLISVPACDPCNRNASQDEEYFLSVLMFTDAGVTDAGKKLWGTLRRMYDRQRGVKSTIASSIDRVVTFTPSGLFLGQRFTIEHNDSRFRSVVTKITRGLYWVEYGQPFPSSVHVLYRFLLTEAEIAKALKYLPETKNGKRSWPGIFEYRYNKVANRPEGSIWLFLFYGVAHFWVVTT